MTSAEWFTATIIAFAIGGVIYFLVQCRNKCWGKKRRSGDDFIWLIIVLLPILWVLDKVKKR